MANTPIRPSRPPVAGDVVVTTVAHHFNVGRVQTAGIVLSTIAVADRLQDAIEDATNAATGRQRVFLYDHADSRHRIEIDCSKV